MLDVISYSTMIKGFCKNDQIEKAMHLFSSLKNENILLDEVFYNSLIDGCSKSQ